MSALFKFIRNLFCEVDEYAEEEENERNRMDGKGGGDSAATKAEKEAVLKSVEVDLLRPDLNAARNFPNNAIHTAKYTLFTFLPLALLFQFRKVSNVYFLFTMILTLIPGASPINPFSSVVPLIVVLAAAMIKDWWEDWKRHSSDRRANNVKAFVLRGCDFVPVASERVMPGDIMLYKLGEEVRADCVVLNTPLPDGLTYIETANLDGETNAKTRRAKTESVERLGTVGDIVRECLPNLDVRRKFLGDTVSPDDELFFPRGTGEEHFGASARSKSGKGPPEGGFGGSKRGVADLLSPNRYETTGMRNTLESMRSTQAVESVASEVMIATPEARERRNYQERRQRSAGVRFDLDGDGRPANATHARASSMGDLHPRRNRWDAVNTMGGRGATGGAEPIQAGARTSNSPTQDFLPMVNSAHSAMNLSDREAYRHQRGATYDRSAWAELLLGQIEFISPGMQAMSRHYEHVHSRTASAASQLGATPGEMPPSQRPSSLQNPWRPMSSPPATLSHMRHARSASANHVGERVSDPSFSTAELRGPGAAEKVTEDVVKEVDCDVKKVDENQRSDAVPDMGNGGVGVGIIVDAEVEQEAAVAVAPNGVVILGSAPCPDLSSWYGQLRFSNGDVVPLGIEQFLPRGCIVRNTDWIICAVVYTGTNTKMLLNLRAKPLKTTRMGRRLNQLNLILFLITQIMIFLQCGLGVWWRNGKLEKEPGVKTAYTAWYIQWSLERYSGARLFWWRYLTNFVLLSYLIPLSLYVTLEFNKAMQMVQIMNDRRMSIFDEFTGRRKFSRPKTSELNCQLPHVKYIFTDKTGTLTENLMTFVGGFVAGTRHDERERPGGLGTSFLRLVQSSVRRRTAGGIDPVMTSEQQIQQLSMLYNPAAQHSREFGVSESSAFLDASLSGHHHHHHARGASVNVSGRGGGLSRHELKYCLFNEEDLCQHPLYRYLLAISLCHTVVCFDKPVSAETVATEASHVKDSHRASVSGGAMLSPHDTFHGRRTPGEDRNAASLHLAHSRTPSGVPFAVAHPRTMSSSGYPYHTRGLSGGWGSGNVYPPALDPALAAHPRYPSVSHLGAGAMDESLRASASVRYHGRTGSSGWLMQRTIQQQQQQQQQQHAHPRQLSASVHVASAIHMRSNTQHSTNTAGGVPVVGNADLIDDSKIYEGQSLDEIALVSAARSNLFTLHSRTAKLMYLKVLGRILCYDIIAELEFTPQRKLMSILLRRNKNGDLTTMEEDFATHGGVPPSASPSTAATLNFASSRKRRSGTFGSNPYAVGTTAGNIPIPMPEFAVPPSTKKSGLRPAVSFGGEQMFTAENANASKSTDFGEPALHRSATAFPGQEKQQEQQQQERLSGSHPERHPYGETQSSSSSGSTSDGSGGDRTDSDDDDDDDSAAGDRLGDIDLEADKRRGTRRPQAEGNSATDKLEKNIDEEDDDDEKPYLLLVKGADTSMLDIMNKKNAHNREMKTGMMEELGKMARQGLRTLVYGQRLVSEQEVLRWMPIFNAAQCHMTDRSGKLHEAYALMERDIDLLGTTAVEDRLQDGVPETLTFFLEAKIVVWMLTGDKRETAVTIAETSGLIDTNKINSVVHLDVSEMEIDTEEQREAALEEASRQLDVAEAACNAAAQEHEELSIVLVVDGRTLSTYFSDRELQKRFFLIGCRCRSAVCCRMTPLQKAQIVQLFQKNTKEVALAVGDGANDVSMIQESKIGVGIMGLEGSQAELASDFAIPKFRFLKRLLVVHGRNSLYRDAHCILFSIYKNVILSVGIMAYPFYSGFSGQVLVDSWLLSMFNFFFCSIQPMVLGILDKDVDDELAETNPLLYTPIARDHMFFSVAYIFKWLSDGAIEGLVLFFFLLYSCGRFDDMYPVRNGAIEDYGTMFFVMLVLIADIRVAGTVTCYTPLSMFLIWLAIAALPWFTLLYSLVHNLAGSTWMVNVTIELMRTARFWFFCLFAISIYVLYALTTSLYLELFHPWGNGKAAVTAARASKYCSAYPTKLSFLRSYFIPFVGPDGSCCKSYTEEDYYGRKENRRMFRKKDGTPCCNCTCCGGELGCFSWLKSACCCCICSSSKKKKSSNNKRSTSIISNSYNNSNTHQQ